MTMRLDPAGLERSEEDRVGYTAGRADLVDLPQDVVVGR